MKSNIYWIQFFPNTKFRNHSLYTLTFCSAFSTQLGPSVSSRHLFAKKKAAKPAPVQASLARQLSLSPPPTSTPPPDFNQCIMGSSHFLPLPFPNHRLASQQNSENMATEKHKIAAAVEEATLLQMSCYSHRWQEAGGNQLQEDGFLRGQDSGCYTPTSREISMLQIQNGVGDKMLVCSDGGLGQKDKRRLSRSSRASSRTRADDLSV